jgi:hypothetical protein
MEWYLDVAQVFHWATKEHFIMWFSGETKRHRRTETVLARLVRRNKLKAVRYGKRLIYTVPRKVKGQTLDELARLKKVAHGLACTECLVRFYRSRMDGEIIAERFFYRTGSVPEWGIRYPNGKMLLLEFSTKSNFLFTNLMNGKISAYQRNLEKTEEKFQAKAIIVFVIDVPRITLERYVGSLNGKSARSAALRSGGGTSPLLPLFFTDYKTFLDVPIGNQLSAAIYFWAHDAKVYSLSSNA